MSIVFLVFFIANLSVQSQNSIMEDTKYGVSYICPPCGCPKDNQHFDSAGICNTCNMAYTAQVKGLEGKPSESSPRRTVAILLYNGADIMDVTGPMSVFEHAGFNVMTVAKDDTPKAIGMSLKLTPNFTFKSLPKVDVIMVPGGSAESNQDPIIVDWLKERDSDTDTMFSVCSGAFYLGAAGILDHQEATTFASLIPTLKNQFPKTKVLNDVKYTNTGHVVTSSGLSSGIDASFEVVAKYYGVGRTQNIANHMEYAWKRKNDYARTQLADNYINQFNDLIRQFSTEFFYSEGDMNSWEYRYQLWDGVEIDHFMKFIHHEMSKVEGFNTEAINNNSFSAIYKHNDLGQGSINLKIENNSNGYQVAIKAKRNKPITPKNTANAS